MWFIQYLLSMKVKRYKKRAATSQHIYVVSPCAVHAASCTNRHHHRDGLIVVKPVRQASGWQRAAIIRRNDVVECVVCRASLVVLCVKCSRLFTIYRLP